MTRSPTLCLLLLLTLAAPMSAQILTVNPANAPAGSTVSLDLNNNTAAPVSVSLIGVPYRVFNEFGTLVWGQGFFSDGIFVVNVAPGATSSTPFDSSQAPGLPLGAGHYYAEVRCLPEPVMARFSLGAPTGNAPDFMFRMSDGLDVHAPSFVAPTLRLTNATAATATFPGATWVASIYGSVLTTGSIPPVTLDAGKSVDFAWPALATPFYPATVSLALTWTDPNAGTHTQTIEAGGSVPNDAETCRTYLPRGSTVPAGSALPVVVNSWYQPACLCPPYPFVPNDGYALMFSQSNGFLTLPAGGGVLPLANDAMLQATLAGMLTGFTPGSPGIATSGGGLPNAGPVGLAFLVHPGPAFSGFSVQMAAISWATGSPLAQPWQASAARTLTLQ